MQLKFLIDECLSPSLADIALEQGHHQSTCVRNRGWAGKKDHQITQLAQDEDFTLVTHNARDFRGGGELKPGGHYALLEVHAGLVCITGDDLDLALQQDLFRVALDEIEVMDDLINKCLEVLLDGDSYAVTVYDISSAL
ncbi:DUF5615 family PIN-like protein [Xanthomonas citri]|uniref:DUF5615 family PIN-like protein n=1 Tax=Xanthomonas citri TaxID=346 RepID=UPI000B5C72AD|nr:DUF5615 family PIN-like protein [Xanthomonas citri]ASL01144.1 hypothetical protein XcvCFBP7113P_12980 [Xanthomonas citri pv. vignicola]